MICPNCKRHTSRIFGPVEYTVCENCCDEVDVDIPVSLSNKNRLRAQKINAHQKFLRDEVRAGRRRIENRDGVQVVYEK